MSYGESAHGAGYFTGEVASYQELNRVWHRRPTKRDALLLDKRCFSYALYLAGYVPEAERKAMDYVTHIESHARAMRLARRVALDLTAPKALKAAAATYLKNLYYALSAGSLADDGIESLECLESWQEE